MQQAAKLLAGALAIVVFAVVALTAAGAVVAGGLPVGSEPAGKPSPGPAPSLLVPTDTTNGMGTPVDRADVRPTYDPDDWESLPEYPDDLGWWASPDFPVALADDPVRRATAAVQITLGPSRANLWVYGADRRWRWLDTSGLDLVDNGGYEIGLDRASLSPDGRRLALGVTEGVLVVDLTTAARTTYPVTGLGPVWTGRAAYWTPDGRAVLLGRSWAALGGSLAYTNGWRIEVPAGSVSRLDFDPSYAALLDDGTVVADAWSERQGHDWSRLAPTGERTPLGELDGYAVHSQPAARGDRWVALRELAIHAEDRSWDGSGFVVLDAAGRPIVHLPVAGTENHGGGGQVIGWVSDSVALFSMPVDASSAGVVAWDVDTGQLWRGPLMLARSFVSVAQP